MERTPINDDPIMEDREDTPTKKIAKSTDDRYMASERDDGSVHTETPVEPSLSTVREEPSKEEAEEKAADKDDEPSPSAPVRQVSGQDTETHSMSGESLTLDDTVQPKDDIPACNSLTDGCSSASALCGAMFGVTELGCKEH